MHQVVSITVAFRWKSKGQWQCSVHESMPLTPQQVEPYIERLCAKAVDADVQLTSIEVRNNISPDRWGQPRWQVPWSWHTRLPLK